jgi:hypothetical protein
MILGFFLYYSGFVLIKGLKNAALTGTGTFDFSPFIPFHIILFMISSDTRSISEKSNPLANAANLVPPGFTSFKLMLEGKLLKIVLFGLLLKQRHIGVAAASYWDKGGRPKINSMVRNIEDEEYIV